MSTGTTTLTYYVPFSGMGTMTSTGTATMKAAGLLVGDQGASAMNVPGGYLGAFNTSKVAVENFGLGMGILEQNARHSEDFFDRNVTQLFGELQNFGSTAIRWNSMKYNSGPPVLATISIGRPPLLPTCFLPPT